MSMGITENLRRHFPQLQFDSAWMLTGTILAALAIFDRAQLPQSIIFVVAQFGAVLPFLGGAIALAAYAKASSADRLIARAFSGHVITMIMVAALLGGLSPFCSCGVIPLIAAMLAMGVPLPAVMAFWLSSPLMDPSMFLLTAGTLGMTFALAKTATAIGVGLLGGFVVLTLKNTALFTNPLKPGIGKSGCGASALHSNKPIHWKFWNDSERRSVFAGELGRSFMFLGKWLILAFLLESLMLAYIPGELIARTLGSGGLGGIVLAALVGIPAYLNGYAALPLMSGLVDAGMDPGAAMAFLIAGGVSSIPAAIAVFALVRLPVFIAYIGIAFAGAVFSGVLFGLATA